MMKKQPSGAPCESRTPRFNLPVRHPPRWRLFLREFLPSPMHTLRLRNLSARMIEDSMEALDKRERCR